jgi:hypothetical protein
MALRILDGNQTSTTLATTVSGGAHYPNHIIASAVTISSLPVQLSTTTIGETARLNVTLSSATTIGATAPSYGNLYGGSDGTNLRAILVDSSGRTTVTGSVSILGTSSVTMGAISGTVTANVLAGQYTTITSGSVTVGSNSGLIDISSYPNGTVFSVEAQPTGGANGVYKIQNIDGFGFGATDISVTNIFTGTSAINISAVGTYSFRKNQFVTHLRFAYVSGTGGNAVYTIRAFSESYWNQTIPVSISSVTIGNTVTVAGTVTANIASTTVTISAQPSGALTTRFGSVTTANTAQITTAVTNTSRKYLLAQNISAGTVTIGIGFSPTTTQGIQLTAGAGLTFDSFVPTGAVYWLGATTGAAYTILEG